MRIALTGMIAAGKSTTLEMFARLGWLTLQTDTLAKEVALSDEGRAKAAELMGEDVSPIDKRFKERFVGDSAFKQSWEEFVHPRVRRVWESFLEKNRAANVVVELPLLYENELESRFDKVVVLTTSLENAQMRWQEKGRPLELYQSLSKQLIPIDQKVKKADYVIHNDKKTPLELAHQIEALHLKLTNDNARRKSRRPRGST